MSSSDRILFANPVSRIDFPSLLLKLGGFIDGLKNASRSVKLLCNNAKLFVLRKRILSSNETDHNVRLHKLPARSYISLIKPINYSPANNDHFRSVLNLSATEGSSSTPPLISNVEEDNDADLYKNGWVMLTEGKLFRRDTNITIDHSPASNDMCLLLVLVLDNMKFYVL